MATLKNATAMMYDFESQTAEVVFPAGQKIDVPELQLYFEDASDGRVKRINVIIGDDIGLVLAKDDNGKWVTIAE